ncbi:MAG: FecR protein, partial [Chloroflexota bacterium]
QRRVLHAGARLVHSVLKTSIWQRCGTAFLVGALLLVACSPAPSGMVATDVNQLAAFEALTGVAAYVPADAEDLGAIALAEQAAAAAAPAAVDAGPPVRAATLSDLVGDVQVRATATAPFAPAVAGLELPAGAEVKTGADGRVRIELTEGTVVRLIENSQFGLAAVSQDASDPSTKVTLAFGSVFAVLAGGSLDIETASGVASVRGSQLGVGIVPGAAGVDVSCMEGTVAMATTDGAAVPVPPGQQAAVAPGQAATVAEVPIASLGNWMESVPESIAQVPGVISPATQVGVTGELVARVTDRVGEAGLATAVNDLAISALAGVASVYAPEQMTAVADLVPATALAAVVQNLAAQPVEAGAAAGGAAGLANLATSADPAKLAEVGTAVSLVAPAGVAGAPNARGALAEAAPPEAMANMMAAAVELGIGGSAMLAALATAVPADVMGNILVTAVEQGIGGTAMLGALAGAASSEALAGIFGAMAASGSGDALGALAAAAPPEALAAMLNVLGDLAGGADILGAIKDAGGAALANLLDAAVELAPLAPVQLAPVEVAPAVAPVDLAPVQAVQEVQQVQTTNTDTQDRDEDEDFEDRPPEAAAAARPLVPYCAPRLPACAVP